MNTLNIPNSDVVIHDGSIVIINRFLGIKWIVHYGWYTYEGNSSKGWYARSIPEGEIIPFTDDDLVNLVVVSPIHTSHKEDNHKCPHHHHDEEDNHKCPHHHHHCGENPDVPTPGQPSIEWLLSRAFITVQTIQERDLIETELMPNGKIVKVNETDDGEPKYFSWNAETHSWDIDTFGMGPMIAELAKEIDDITSDFHEFKWAPMFEDEVESEVDNSQSDNS